jgi:hypothetical protein
MRIADILILGVLLAVLLLIKGRRFLPEFMVRAAAARTGRSGDPSARELLLRRGYRIMRVNERLEFQANVNGKQHRGHLQADFIVHRDRKCLAVKVEPSGEQAAMMTKAEGRWQLLQLQLLSGTRGVLVVDLENKKIYKLAFNIKTTARQKEIFLLFFLSGAIAGAVAVMTILSGGGLLP